jgi:hypothetical protein
MRLGSRLAALLAGTLLVGMIAAPGASAERNIELGFADDVLADNLLFNADESVRSEWARRIDRTGASLVRLNLYWSRVVADGEPADATDPDDPAYDWAEIDRAVSATASRGLDPVLTVLSAPPFAEGADRPSYEEARLGTWKPRAGKLRDFAVALATRYSGAYPDPLSPGGSLPAVVYYEGWNEPNLQLYINPQRSAKDRNRSPEIYRRLLNGFYEGITSVGDSNLVLAAGTSPFGDETGDRRIPPLEFWRDVFCLKNRKKLKSDKRNCPQPSERAKLDIFSHNSINSPGDGPSQKAALADNATPADMHKLVDVIRAAEKHGTVRPGGERREVWSTELWYQSNPPEPKGSSLRKHARQMVEAMYLLWKQKVSAAIFLQVRDSPYSPDTPAVVGLQSGVYFVDGSKKPALDAVRFPFVAERRNRRQVVAWGKAERSGRLVVEKRKGNGWRKLARVQVRAGEVFKEKLKLRGRQSLRAKVGKQRSMSWKVARK